MNPTPIRRVESGPSFVGSEDASLGHLFSRLASETGSLIQQELKLATTEMTNKATFATKQLAFLGIAGFCASLAVFALTTALVLGLAPVIPMWASTLFLGVLFSAIAGGLALKATHSLRSLELTPKHTVATLEDTKLWLQQQVR